jgi:long-chain acyl-CoA synthetase
MTLSTLLRERAFRHPERVAIKFLKNKITYYELNTLVSEKAGGLRLLGLNTGDRVAVLMENCPEYIISYFSILRAGGVSVPVNTFLTPVEVEYIVRDSGVKILIYGQLFVSHAEEIKKCIPEITVIRYDEIPHQHFDSHNEYGDDTAVILYTSGTTGTPKGAMLTHNNLLSNAEACKMAMHLLPSDRILVFLPLFHSFSFTVCVILPLYTGFTIILLPSVKPFSRIIKTIIRERVTLFVAIPSVYAILAKKKFPFFVNYLLKLFLNIRICVSGAAALSGSVLKAFEERFRIPLLEGYGLTEASPVISVNPLHGIRKKGSVGLPLPGIEVVIFGENGERLPANEVGELAVKGPNVMKGYFNKEDDTHEAIRDGWLFTGDLAKIDNDGYIYIVDRKKDLIIVDGMNIYPREVEDVVLSHPSVEECAMVGVESHRGDELPVLFLKLRDGAVIDENGIIDHLRKRIARYKLPKKIHMIKELPKTGTGKIKKTELRKWRI